MKPRLFSIKEQIALAVVAFEIISFCANAVISAEEEAQNLKLKIDRVALYKNGVGFVSSSAILPSQARVLRLGQLPVPAYGDIC